MMQTVLRTEAQGSLAAHQAKIAEIRTAMWGKYVKAPALYQESKPL
jgi:hypothetical protein